MIHGALEQAVKEGKLCRNVSKLVKLPKKNHKETQPLTVEEINKFLDAAKDDRLYPAFLLELNTGLRRGELLGLRWKDFNPNKGTIMARQTVQRIYRPSGGKISLTQPANKAA